VPLPANARRRYGGSVIRELGRAAALGLARGPLHGLVRRGTVSGLLPAYGFRSGPMKRQPFDVAVGDGHSFKYQPMPTTDVIGRSLYWQGLGGYEPFTLSLFAEEARRAHDVGDLGANTGLFTLLACAVNPDLVVHAFEAAPRVAAALKRNTSSSMHTGQRCTLRPSATRLARSPSLHQQKGRRTATSGRMTSSASGSM
jgi:hypothetical protein